MSGHHQAFHNRLRSRRLGGPIPFEALWSVLREDLQAVYMASGELLARLDAATACEASSAELGASSATTA